ncbi:TPA: hypothetical protein ACXRYW_005291 [Klebsiella variicola subsp. variicola]
MKIQELTGEQKQNLRKIVKEVVKALEKLERSKAEYHYFIYNAESNDTKKPN